MNNTINRTPKIIAPAVAAAILTATPKVQAGVGDFVAGLFGGAAVATVTAATLRPSPPPPPAHACAVHPAPSAPPAYHPAPPSHPAYHPAPCRPAPPSHAPKGHSAPKGHGVGPGRRR